MPTTLGNRIAALRKEKHLKQEDLAEMLGVSGQAVSKWENDQTCPDISLLPQLADILGITVDELLSGKPETTSSVQILPEEQRKNIRDMMFRIVIDSAEGDKVRINLPLALIQTAIDCGVDLPQISGNDALQYIDWSQLMSIISQGVIGNLVDVETADGNFVRIFVE